MPNFKMRQDKPSNRNTVRFSVGGVFPVDQSQAPAREPEATPVTKVMVLAEALQNEPEPAPQETLPEEKPLPVVVSLPPPKRGKAVAQPQPLETDDAK